MILDFKTIFQCNNVYYSNPDDRIKIKDKEYNFLKVTLHNSHDELNRYIKRNNQKLSLNACYIFKSILTGDFYIGSTNHIGTRIKGHAGTIKALKHKNPRVRELSKDHNLFDFEIIVIFTKDRDDAFDLEQYFLEKYANDPAMMNIAIDARLT